MVVSTKERCLSLPGKDETVENDRGWNPQAFLGRL